MGSHRKSAARNAVSLVPSTHKFIRHSDNSVSDSSRAKVRQRSNASSLRRKPERVCVCDRQLISRARDPGFGFWVLRVSHNGNVDLQHNNAVVSSLSHKDGAALLHMEGCPFERAEDVIARVTADLAVVVSDEVRNKIEFDLARWIPLYFD